MRFLEPQAQTSLESSVLRDPEIQATGLGWGISDPAFFTNPHSGELLVNSHVLIHALIRASVCLSRLSASLSPRLLAGQNSHSCSHLQITPYMLKCNLIFVMVRVTGEKKIQIVRLGA